MKVGYKKLGMVLGAVAAVAILPARADAQFVRYSPVFWSFEGNGGVAIPVGDLSDVAEIGPSFGIAGSYFLNPRFALRVEGSLDIFGEGDDANVSEGEAELRAWHFTGGFEYHITDPATSGLFATFDAGAGGVTFDTDVFAVDDVVCDPVCTSSPGAQSTGNFDNSYFALNGGLKVGYNFARGSTGVPIATFFVGGDVHIMFSDEEESSLLAAANGQSGFGTAIAIPITAGIRFNIP